MVSSVASSGFQFFCLRVGGRAEQRTGLNGDSTSSDDEQGEQHVNRTQKHACRGEERRGREKRRTAEREQRRTNRFGEPSTPRPFVHVRSRDRSPEYVRASKH